MADRLIFHLLVAFIFLAVGVGAFITYSKRRTRRSLVTLMVAIIVVVGALLSLFYPVNLEFTPYGLLLDIVFGLGFLYYLLRANAIYYYRRTRYNLAQLIISILLFVGIVVNYFYPVNLKVFGAKPVQIAVVVIPLVLFVLFLYYPYLSRYLGRRKMKHR